jgi:hypothetical protein
MKTKILLPTVLLIIIAILGGSLIYEVIQRHRAAKGEEQFIIALSVHLHNALAQGDVKFAKDKLDSIVTSYSLGYEQTYGQEAETSTFQKILAQAKTIRADYETTNNTSR